jgi:biopolymer transport protein ExbB
MIFAIVDWLRVFKEAGWLAYPLIAGSAVAVFIICERAFALRRAAVLPPDLADAVLQNRPASGGDHSVLGRVIHFAERHAADPDATKAYARLEVMKMERGVRYLDVIYTGAPLLGLIGTVSGLLEAFNSTRNEITGLPDPARFTQSVGYALSATLLGLCVALVALGGSGYIQRRIDHHAAQLDVLLERVLARVRPPVLRTTPTEGGPQ